jgi:c-di-GMP-binding flagellar brake protein YcgR
MLLFELQKALKAEQSLLITVWDPKNEKTEYTFPSYVITVEGFRVQIAGPAPQAVKLAPLLQPNTIIGIVLEINPAPFIFYPTIESVESDGSCWMTLSKDSQVEKFQNRNHVRIAMITPFQFEYQSEEGKWLPMSARTVDLSGGGVKFTCPQAFEKGTILKIFLKFGPDTPMLILKGKVVFSAENRFCQKPEDFYTTGCQFFDLNESQETLLMKECFRRELHLKR